MSSSTRRSVRCLRAARFAWIAVVAIAGAPAWANIYTVTKTTDTFDGACTPSDCSLREAIAAANSYGGAPHTVMIPAGTYQMTRSGQNENNSATGDFDLWNNPMIIVGAGAASTIINGGGLDQVFEINGETVSITGITVRNGLGGISLFGGARLTMSDSVIFNNTRNGSGGGISAFDYSSIALTRVTVQGNNVSSASFDGAGIYVKGTMSLTDCTIVQNGSTPTHYGAGIYSAGYGAEVQTISGGTIADNGFGGTQEGGGLYAVSPGEVINIVGTDIEGNSAASGGGLYFYYMDSVLRDVNIHGNHATWYGGGISGQAGIRIESSTISQNDADSGGGIAFVVYGAGGNAVFDRLLLDSNVARADGGGMVIRGSTTNNALVLTNSTFLYNRVTGNDGSSLGNHGGGISLAGFLRFELANNLLRNNYVAAYPGSSGTGGAAIAVVEQAGGSMQNLTLYFNQTSVSSGSSFSGGAIFVASSAPVSLTNLTFEGNSAPNGVATALFHNTSTVGSLSAKNTLFGTNAFGPTVCVGAFSSLGYNLDPGTTCGLSAPSDQSGQIYAVDPIGDYGGPTDSMMPTSSTLIDKGGNIGCPATDQRGAPRPFGSSCDIGAVEAGATVPVPETPIFVNGFEGVP